ncbi:hypothetical protein [Paenibacillus sanguinis]|uniref:hypothetical protein n=1 Tax=Paenibacillus sanguinis TaxID=225906 RepID=UPI000370FA3A|nr:hypothetical protein [Paenibacillus sanguinis]
MSDPMQKITDIRLLSLYKEGFSHISSAVEEVEFLWPQTADTLVGAYGEINDRLLNQVREERMNLEAEVKRFLAKSNSQLVYLANLEKHLRDLQSNMQGLYEEAKLMQVFGEGGDSLEEAGTDATRGTDKDPPE